MNQCWTPTTVKWLQLLPFWSGLTSEEVKGVEVMLDGQTDVFRDFVHFSLPLKFLAGDIPFAWNVREGQ